MSDVHNVVLPGILAVGLVCYFLFSVDTKNREDPVVMVGGSNLCPDQFGDEYLDCYLGKHKERFFVEHSFQQYNVLAGSTLMHHCKTKNLIEIRKARESIVNRADDDGNTPLHVLASTFPFDQATLDAVRALRGKGADVTKENRWGVTAQYVFRMHVEKCYPKRTGTVTEFLNTIYAALGPEKKEDQPLLRSIREAGPRDRPSDQKLQDARTRGTQRLDRPLARKEGPKKQQVRPQTADSANNTPSNSKKASQTSPYAEKQAYKPHKSYKRFVQEKEWVF